MARRYLHLASNRLFWRVGDPYVRPWSVDVSVAPAPAKVTFAEGITFSAVAATVSIEEALDEQWRDHFARAEGAWLLPLLQRIGNGEAVTEAELVDHFVRLHGRPPTVTESPHV